MQAIDELCRMKNEGVLSFLRFGKLASSPDENVTETVAVQLRTPTDPPGRVIQKILIEWVPHFSDGELAPRINAEGGALKMLALYPEILAPFFEMSHGQITPDAFVTGLVKIGIAPYEA